MKTQIGYKLFEQDQKGNLYALFIDKKNIMPMNTWMLAGSHPTKGFAVRPGFHIGEGIPSAPWLMSVDGTYKSQRSKYWKRVWAEVEYVAEHDYTTEVELFLPKKCFETTTPKNGFYRFREAGVNRIWIIADQMKINRILSEEERQTILANIGYDEQQAFAPYKAALERRMKNTTKGLDIFDKI